MAETVKLPKWGLTMEEAEIVEWLVQVGSPVAKDQILATLSTEKVEVDLPAPRGGIVAAHLVPPGRSVPVGTDLAVIVDDETEFHAYEADRG